MDIENQHEIQQDQIKGGNSCLFFTLKVLNLIFAIAAIGLVALGIWLWMTFGAFNPIQIFFVAIGVFELILVGIAWSARRSVAKLRCYLIIMGALFIVELTTSIIAFALRDKIIDEVAAITNAQTEIDKLKEYLDIVALYVVGSIVLNLILFGLTYRYIGSVKDHNQEYDYKVLDQDGKKITIQQKNQIDTERIKDKYAQKRSEMSEKYGRLNNQ